MHKATSDAQGTMSLPLLTYIFGWQWLPCHVPCRVRPSFLPLQAYNLTFIRLLLVFKSMDRIVLHCTIIMCIWPIQIAVCVCHTAWHSVMIVTFLSLCWWDIYVQYMCVKYVCVLVVLYSCHTLWWSQSGLLYNERLTMADNTSFKMDNLAACEDLCQHNIIGSKSTGVRRFKWACIQWDQRWHQKWYIVSHMWAKSYTLSL